jgi:hypothetical protein
MAMPHTSKMIEMGGIAILKAEALFAEGKTREGLDWLIIAHRMARHAGAGDVLISNLVQIAIEGNALRAAARHSLSWDQETRHTYAGMLQALPPLHSTQAAFGGENIFVDWIENKFNGARSKDDAEKLLKSLFGEFKPEDEPALAAELAPGALHEALAELRTLERRTATALGKPWPQAQPEIQKINDEASHSSHYLVRVSFPTITNVADKQYVIATLRTMLDAALEHGPQLNEAAAASYHDAFAGDPLQLQKNDGTLTLTTAHEYRPGKNVSLKLGK